MENKIGIIGLGYVGLPLAVEFSTRFDVVGFDINLKRISQLKELNDETREVSSEKLAAAERLSYTTEIEDLRECNFIIITVPTPIDKYKNPDLGPLKSASELAGSVIQKGDIVIYESTVYPGCTEEECVPILEAKSGLSYNTDFFCGYSPERINPGDPTHSVDKIVKVTSGSTDEVAEKVDQLYKSIITAGTHKASSIKVAEASKVIENAQRDINIAFVNELALIFDLMELDTKEVLEAAGTKWNFLKFHPGLVGGHCIGVDPYYLTHKAEQLGYHPEVILSGRRINDNMGEFVAQKFVKLMVEKNSRVMDSHVLILGITFKENCPDIRNTMVTQIISELQGFGLKISVYDPEADSEEVKELYGIELIDKPEGKYDGIIHAVAHRQFEELDLQGLKHEHTVIYDVKSTLKKGLVDKRL